MPSYAALERISDPLSPVPSLQFGGASNAWAAAQTRSVAGGSLLANDPHVDYSARVQTVHKETNPRYHALISKFKERTGCPVVINTSFNVRGEPIVRTPEDAFRCFMGSDMETLVIGNAVLKKRDQDMSLAVDYKDEFELD